MRVISLKEFDVFVQNKPGELAKICELFGNQGVNIKAIASDRGNERPMIKVVTDDETTAKSALSRTGIGYALRDVLAVRMPDRPGELGKIARKLARAMVNVDSIYILGKEGGMTEIAFTVDNIEKATNALK
ncbi:MAG TPA: ACT domain-containing protein [Thermoplasmata archaeon]|nr:ACT domain-containing protein [Thermoplasmata archaeon]